MMAGRALSVFLCGEGRNELGSRYGDPVHQTDDEPGILVTLLRRVKPDSWTIGSARVWKTYRKYRVPGLPPRGEAATVCKIALDASEAKCDVAAFLRDEDGDPSRREQIDGAIEVLRARRDQRVAIAGSVVVPAIEGWVLACKKIRRTETMSRQRAAAQLKEMLAPEDVTTAAMVEIVENADFASLPDDVHSLNEWRQRAEAAFREAASRGA